jgi:hypothetical protein
LWKVEESLLALMEMVVDCCLRLVYYCFFVLLLSCCDTLFISHTCISYFIIVYILLKVEEVTVLSDDGTNSRDDGLRDGDVLVSSHCDETGGVAKVDVS